MVVVGGHVDDAGDGGSHVVTVDAGDGHHGRCCWMALEMAAGGLSVSALVAMSMTLMVGSSSLVVMGGGGGCPMSTTLVVGSLLLLR